MLITTGKNADSNSRLIAKALFLCVPGSRILWRGRRTLRSMVSKARKQHMTRLCVIQKNSGEGHSLGVLQIGTASWSWLSPAIEITAVSSPKIAKKLKQSTCLKITGKRSKDLGALISHCNSNEKAESRISATSKRISFHLSNIKLLSLGVSYEKHK